MRLSREKNKAIIRRYYDDLWNKWDLSAVDDIIGNEITFRGSLAVTVQGREGFKSYVALVRSAFPDFHNTIEDLVAEGDKVVARLTYRGTHQGELFGIAPRGERVTYAGIASFRIAGGKIVEGWVLGDVMGLLRQLGACMPGDRIDHSRSVENITENGIEYKQSRDLPVESVLNLYQANGWSAAEKPKELLRALSHSHSLITAWEINKLVGLGNALSDGSLVVYYPHLLILPEYQGLGIGRRLMRILMTRYEGFHQHVLVADDRAIEFYEKCGFERAGKTEPMWIFKGHEH